MTLLFSTGIKRNLEEIYERYRFSSDGKVEEGDLLYQHWLTVPCL